MQPRRSRRQPRIPWYRWLCLAIIGLAVASVAVPALAAPGDVADVLQVLGEGLDAVRVLVQDAYCAIGIDAFC